MAILDYLLRKKKKPTASVAKERLQIILAHENGNHSGPDYLPELKQELLQVISKYTHIDLDEIKVQLDKDDGCDILEVNVVLPKK
ncbi:cell division topological specificity factor MinE [Pseudomonadota bacterium]